MPRKEIIDKTLGEVRSFLDELSNGTSRYRSLHSLTEQVEHQYEGRFLIELIQNAHDVLFEDGTGQRIEIVLVENEPPYGALYVANDGQPLTQSNFKALSNLGQSDKDPQKSIGNKGIGFRSVLQITKAPEIYSRKERNSPGFDGYCFSFNPAVIGMFEGPIQGVVDGDNYVMSPEIIGGQLLEWDDARYEYFREQCHSLEKDWLPSQLAFLSPYTLPIPLDTDESTSQIGDFERRGFSTVIRLPFLSDRARDVATNKVQELNERTILFLHRINIFRLVCGGVEKLYQREQTARFNDIESGFDVRISNGRTEGKEYLDLCSRYWLWSKTVGGIENSDEQEKIKVAVADLPGKWPTVDKAIVEVAVKIDDKPDDGVLNIYLPTLVPSGCAAHFSAPFFGDMSRTDIDFEKPFNSLLLKSIASKTADVILGSLSGGCEIEAAAIIDILAPADSVEGVQWWGILGEAFLDRDVDIRSQNIVFSDEGWSSLIKTRLLPELDSQIVINPELLRSESTYLVFSDSLQEREAGLRRIFHSIDISPEVKLVDSAATVEAIAKKLHESQKVVNWNGFWQDVESLFGRDTRLLTARKVLLGTDDQLHVCDEQCSVFFRPRSSGTDDEISVEGGIDDIPQKLRPYIAFLNEAIEVHIPRAGGGVQNTPVHAYLSSGLVETYGVERIFSNVLVKATPKLPFELDGRDSNLCRDILQWSLKLINASKGSMDEAIRLLSRLPAPCVGGWYPIGETSFGPGWPEKNGLKLDTYLRRNSTSECSTARARLLLPPDHPLWGGMGLRSVALLERAGAFDGIRLIPASSKDWSEKLTIANYSGVKLPEQSPPGFSMEMWDAYRHFIKETVDPYYSGEFEYELLAQTLFIVPGFEGLDSFEDDTCELLMGLMFGSIPLWDTLWPQWKRVIIRKIRGESHSFSPDSPLAFSLKKMSWMQGTVGDKKVQFRPSDRWYIPSPALIGGSHQFSHLQPMPTSIASILGKNPLLITSMNKLGMPSYDPEEETADLRLLNDLVVALEDPAIDISNLSVFLGQVRTAWSQLHPEVEGALPDSLIVQNGTGPLRIASPSEEKVYLPDATTAVHNGLKLHSQPVIEIETKDAKRLQGHFQNAYADGIRLASELTTRALVDGEKLQDNDGAKPLSHEIPWLIPVVLSVIAFSRVQSRGVATKTFTKAVGALRRTQIIWVDRLEAGLWHGELSVARSAVTALWLSKSNILLAANKAKADVSLLSEVLATIVDRGDIDIPLKLVLGGYESTVEITDEEIYESLSKLNISVDQYQDVQQRWLGDLAWNIRLTRPLILLMQSDKNIGLLDEISSEEQFRSFLDSCDLSPLNVDSVLSIMMGARELKSVGFKVWEILGERAELFQWNKVLSKLNESVIVNDQANEQFQRHLGSSRQMMRSIIRATLRQYSESKEFTVLDAELSSINCPRKLAEDYWVVGFEDVMKELLGLLAEWHTEPSVVAAVAKATSAEGLRNQLDDLGLAPGLDPMEIHAANRKLFFSVLECIQKVAIAWCLREDVNVGIWGEDNDSFERELAEGFSKTAFVDFWDEAMCFMVLRRMKQNHEHEGFAVVLKMVSSVNDLMRKLGVSDTDLKEAHGKIEQRKQKRELQKKTVNVCGTDFVNTEGNLNNLWDHILGAIVDNDVAEIDLSDLEVLKDQTPSKKRKKRDKKLTSKKKAKGRMSQSMKDLIGLAGEIHGYRALQKVYGTDAVGPSSWISDNSRHKYPENTTSDGYGCDFTVYKNGKEHYIEVKATQGEDETFELGSSEVELAIDSANRRKKEFMILHVLDALSGSPKFRLLPNPYDRKHKDKYKFEEAGLRVRYEAS